MRAILLLAAVILAAGCRASEDDAPVPTPTPSIAPATASVSYESDMEATMAAIGAEFETLIALVGTDGTSPATWDNAVNRSADRMIALVEELRSLQPPARLASWHMSVVPGYEKYLEAMLVLKRAVAANMDPTLYAEFQRLLAAGDAIIRRANIE